VVAAHPASLTRLRYRIVDVFTERPLAGNALCVVLDECPPERMAAIAREVNLSETTFPTVVGPDEYRMRIFTPAAELPYAGHPTLGTAWALGPNRWRQTTAGATIAVESDTDGAAMEQPDPVFEEVDVEAAAAVVGLTAPIGAWLATAGGLGHLVMLADQPIDELAPNTAVLPADRTAAVVRRIDDRTLQVRAFVGGVGEDPGTGSAAGPIAVLAHEHLGTNVDVTVHQGDLVGRPCRIGVHAEPGAIRVSGRVAACAEGVFTF
jgi:trans-2,3-dihydro-3-hydroxyanthranilate isomerase